MLSAVVIFIPAALPVPHSLLQYCHQRHSADVQVCLLGSRDEFVASGSDDGRIFVWDRFTGRLVNMLSSDDQNVSCVAAHPSMPVLVSAGSEPVIKLWSPQVGATVLVQGSLSDSASMLDQQTALTSCNLVVAVEL